MHNERVVPLFISNGNVVESDNTAVLFEKGNIFIFDEIEWEICKLCNGSYSISTIAETLSKKYNAPINVILSDISDYIDSMEKKQLIRLEQEALY